MRFLALNFPAIDPVAVSFGPFAVKWYGLAYVAGLLLGWLYIKKLVGDGRLWAGGKAPITAEAVDDLFLWVALGVVLGGRLGNVLLYDAGYYLRHPLEIFQIWKGGMAFHGGMLGVIVAAWLFGRRYDVRPLTIMDLTAAAVPIGLFFGRIANFINAEVVGRESNAPWAMAFCNDIVRRYNQGTCPAGDVPRHPSQLYEAALEGLALFLILRWLTHGKGALARPGLVGGAFLAGYGALRIVCEMFKHDEYRAILGSLPLTSGMAYCIPMVLAGWWLIRNARAAQPA